ncbi:broad-complex core protein isoforms 1/2/3/4/5 isoform X2 [Anabrus simplex]|uniref:broad-complex core protein isoforms 1/2/3/4/5 isoform X2 n=1 Tax=Anabrus simplex TaxID=316456 RepID=UPI0034DCF683
MVDLEAEHFSLRWNNFHSNMSTGFQALLQEEDMVDVTLAASGEFVHAHKIVLSVCSPYFKLLFKANPCKHPIVILKDVCHKDLVDILQFMYQGEVNVRQEDLATFLKTAEMLQVKGLTGRDSPPDSPEPDLPIPYRPTARSTPKPRSARSTVPDKPTTPKQSVPPPAPHVPVEKKPPSEPDEGRAPPFKRIRPEPSLPAAAAPQSPQPNNEDSMGLDYTPVSNPKEEPVDSDMEQMDDKTSLQEGQQDDSLMKLLSADTSHASLSLGDPGQSSGTSGQNVTVASVPSGAMVSIPSMSLDSGSQEGSQGQLQYVTSRCGNLQLVLDGYLYNFHKRSGPNKYWRCTEYRKLQCRGFSKTLYDKVALTTQPHNHERLHDRIAARAPIHAYVAWDQPIHTYGE